MSIANGTEMPQQPQQPVLFKQLQPLDVRFDGDLRLQPGDYRFAAEATALPLAYGEFGLATHDYPIVFTQADTPIPVAVMGYRHNENLFVEANGQWRPDCYIPAYARCYPFIMVDGPEAGKRILCVDRACQFVNRVVGDPLFEAGKATPRLSEIVMLSDSFQNAFRQTEAFTKTLADAGLLKPHTANLRFGTGGLADLSGFLAVEAADVAKLPDRTLLKLHHKGFLAPLYQHLNSLDRWRMIAAVATERLVAAGPTAATPTETPAAEPAAEPDTQA